MIARILFSSIVLLLAMTGAASSQPKRVLIVHSFGRDFSPWDDYSRKIREELRLQSKDPIDIFEASLSTARFPDGNEDAFVSYLNAVFSERKLDLIMTIGGPAARFFQQNRARIFPSIPTLYAAVAQQMSSNAPATDAMVPVTVDVLSTPNQILKLLPETTKLFIVIGNSPIEKRWLEEMRKLFQPLTGRLEITYTDELSLEQIVEQVAALPPRTFIVYGQMLGDRRRRARRESRPGPASRSRQCAHLFGTGRILRPRDHRRPDDQHIGRQPADCRSCRPHSGRRVTGQH